IGDYEKAFTLIIQRKAIQGQASLDLESEDCLDEINQGGYVYRAIATNRDTLSDCQTVHWYNQRAEDSENRIKELKLDFGGGTLPCSDFNANALYFLISALSYNLFALMRQLLPGELAQHRAITIRWRLYGMAAKVVKTGRQLFVKLAERHRMLLEQVLIALKAFEPPPI
ncbi:transposase, partial [Thiolapillus sp.]